MRVVHIPEAEVSGRLAEIQNLDEFLRALSLNQEQIDYWKTMVDFYGDEEYSTEIKSALESGKDLVAYWENRIKEHAADIELMARFGHKISLEANET